jgi:hypothetical protein
VIVEGSWNRTRLQILFVQRIVSVIDEEHGRIIDETLAQLASKLSLAASQLEKVVEKDKAAELDPSRKGLFNFKFRTKRTRYVMIKESLDSAIKNMEEWQRRFDPSWFLLMKIADPIIDKELNAVKNIRQEQGQEDQPLRVQNRTLDIAQGLRKVLVSNPQTHISVLLPRVPLNTIEIPFSTAKAGRRINSSDQKWMIIDSIACPQGKNVEALAEDMRNLATKLSRSDPMAFGLLNCKGLMKIMDQSQQNLVSLDLIFRAPDGMEVLQSLRQVPLNAEPNYSLSRKIRVAKGLAKSVSSVHLFNFVHKNIRPESILLFEDTEASQSSTFLVGFDKFRSVDGGTSLIGDLAWHNNVYRHPSRQGEFPDTQYTMQHDIYSLGITLLEIGLWESFVPYTAETRPQPRHDQAYSEFATWLKKKGYTQNDKSSSNAAYLGFMSFRLKEYSIDLAKTKLPARMGEKYTQIVILCLTCLDDDDNNEFQLDQSVEVTNSNDSEVGIQFIEKILLQLEEISI